MLFDLFISYSRRDNARGQVAALSRQIEKSFRSFAGRNLRVFLDTLPEDGIKGMDDWRHKIQRSLRESHLFVAVLSPNYLASPYCRWEWEDYVRYEAMRQCLGEGVAPVFFVTLPNATDPKPDQTIARWIDTIHQRQTFDLRPWHDHGEKALQEAHVKTTLEQLHASVRERLDRAERAMRSPNNLIKHNPAFVGRVRELTELRNTLAKNKLGVVGACEGQVLGRATVQGIGGMGKTELALAYAHAFAWDYPGGRWQLRCEHVADLRVALLQLAGPLGFDFTDEENKSLALGFERVLRELARSEQCLIVLDNVSDTQLLEPEHVDRLPRDGHVDLIVTTRLAPHDIPGSAQEQAFIAVDELPEEDALALLRGHQMEGRFPSQAEDDEARGIVQMLEGFTLAVETAAIYLGRHTAPDTCLRFRARLQASLFTGSEVAASDPTVAVRHRERLLAKTLAFTLETLSPEARHLLMLGALLPAEAVALPWLATVAASELQHSQHRGGAPGTVFREAVDQLRGLRLFQNAGLADSTGMPLVARMHRLVQELVRQQGDESLALCERELQEHVQAQAVSLMDGWVETANRWEVEPLVACAWLWLEHPGTDGPLLACRCHKPLYELARYAEVETMMRHALGVVQRRFGPAHANVATCLNLLAASLQETNRSEEAEMCYRRALAIHQQTNPPDDVGMSDVLNNLAVLLRSANRLAEAETLLQKSLLIRERTLGPDHHQVGNTLGNLGALFQTTNRLTEAEPLLRRALLISQRHFGPDHPRGAIYMGNLGQLLHDANRLEEAESLLRRALEINERSLGPDHPDVAVRLNNLGQLLQHTDRLAEAEPVMRRALAIDEGRFGSTHPKVAQRLNNLSELLRVTNRPAEAEPLVRRALAIAERSLGPSHPDLAQILNNLAELLRATNRHAEAEPLIRRSVLIYEQSFGPNDPAVATAINNLAELLRATSRLSEAEPLLRRALAIDEASLGPYHPNVATVLSNLAGLLQDTNRLAEAELLERRALAIDEACLGPNHSAVAVRLNNLALLLQHRNRASEAEPVMRRALAIWEQSVGPDHPEVARTLCNLSQLLAALNRRTEAEPLVRRALLIDERSLGPDHPSVARDLNNLVALLAATNRVSEAEPLLRRVVVTCLRFTQSTGHPHPHLHQVCDSYAKVLAHIGYGPQKVLAQLNELASPFGISMGGK